MHPNPAFRVHEDDAALAFVAATGFAHLFLATPDGPMVAHAPVTRDGARFRFHVARANRITRHLEGARLLLSCTGAEGYISPNWYARPGDQVPTWNYRAVELEGSVAALDEDALTGQLDALAATFEPQVNPGDPWHRDKMDDAVFRKMLRAIQGFEATVDTVRASFKLSQNKPDADRAGVIAGLRAGGNAALADAMMPA